MNGNLPKILTAMSRQTGLHRETIKDLMKKGWLYEETATGFAIFKHPVSRTRNG